MKMLTLVLTSIIIGVVAASIVVRLLMRAVWNPYRVRRPYFGPYGYYGYGRGYCPRRFPGFLAILMLAALGRVMGRRW
jgi:hypothetical protein